MALRTHRSRTRFLALLAVAALAGCMTMPPEKPPQPMLPQPPGPAGFQLRQTRFEDLRGWTLGDMRAGLSAFLRSCAAIAQKPDDAPMGGLQYAGTAAEWKSVCGAATNANAVSAEAARARGAALAA